MTTLSSASTAATESSQSMIVVIADSSQTSEICAGSLLPIAVEASMHDVDMDAVVLQQDESALAASP